MAMHGIRDVFVCLSSPMFDRICVVDVIVYESSLLCCVPPFSSFPKNRKRQATGAGHCVGRAMDDDPSSNVEHDVDERPAL
jgi:hypothetical protein